MPIQGSGETATATAALARWQTVSKTFENGVQALDRFSLEVGQGERLGLLGVSGCGKSTALRIIAGLEAPSGGETMLDLPERGALGFVFQSPVLMPWLTVAGNVRMPLRLAGQASETVQEQVEAMLEKVGLADFRSAYPRELSGGMQMRVSIARALVTRPSLLLMDEPFAALDEITRFHLNDLLLERQERDGFGVVFVTHSVFESVYLCDRVAVMTPRPGSVDRVVNTIAKRSRDSDYRTSRTYIDLCRTVSDALRATTNRDGAMQL